MGLRRPRLRRVDLSRLSRLGGVSLSRLRRSGLGGRLRLLLVPRLSGGLSGVSLRRGLRLLRVSRLDGRLGGVRLRLLGVARLRRRLGRMRLGGGLGLLLIPRLHGRLRLLGRAGLGRGLSLLRRSRASGGHLSGAGLDAGLSLTRGLGLRLLLANRRGSSLGRDLRLAGGVDLSLLSPRGSGGLSLSLLLVARLGGGLRLTAGFRMRLLRASCRDSRRLIGGVHRAAGSRDRRRLGAGLSDAGWRTHAQRECARRWSHVRDWGTGRMTRLVLADGVGARRHRRDAGGVGNAVVALLLVPRLLAGRVLRVPITPFGVALAILVPLALGGELLVARSCQAANEAASCCSRR